MSLEAVPHTRFADIPWAFEWLRAARVAVVPVWFDLKEPAFLTVCMKQDEIMLRTQRWQRQRRALIFKCVLMSLKKQIDISCVIHPSIHPSNSFSIPASSWTSSITSPQQRWICRYCELKFSSVQTFPCFVSTICEEIYTWVAVNNYCDTYIFMYSTFIIIIPQAIHENSWVYLQVILP